MGGAMGDQQILAIFTEKSYTGTLDSTGSEPWAPFKFS